MKARLREMEQPAQLPPAGWYADPDNPDHSQRYWDGVQWTEQRAPYAQPPSKAKGNDALVAAGYIFSLLIPIVGLVIGGVLLGRKDKHGPWVFGLSIFFIAAFVVLGIVGNGAD